MSTEYDGVIIGGGPAGATAATVLAQHGRNVILLERDQFPRYHVGESLTPFCYFPLKRLGLADTLQQSDNPKKYCVQFVRTDGSVSQPFYFFQHMDHPSSTTWQVWRSEFDQLLLDNAREKGASVLEETKAKALAKEGDRVVGAFAYDRERGRFRLFAARAVVLASGGIGRAFKVTSNSWEYTGDGHALAYRAGADLMDMEFVQFHPTGMVWPPSVR